MPEPRALRLLRLLRLGPGDGHGARSGARRRRPAASCVVEEELFFETSAEQENLWLMLYCEFQRCHRRELASPPSLLPRCFPAVQ